MEKRAVLDKTLGEYLKELREERCLSTEKLGEQMGIAKSMVWYIENGKRMPSIDSLYVYADFFSVDFDVLMEKRFTCVRKSVEELGDKTPPHIKDEFHLIQYLGKK